MPNRAVLLRWNLYCLAVAAVAGVLAVLTSNTSNYDVLGRVVGTCICLAIALGVGWRILSMLDRKETRVAGIFGFVAVGIELVLVVALIWGDASILSFTLKRFVGMLAMVLPAITFPGMACLLLVYRDDGRIAGLAGLGFTALAAIAFFISGYVNSFGSAAAGTHYDAYLATGWTLLGLGGLIVLALIGAGTNDRRWWRWGGVVAAVISLGMAMRFTWGNLRGDSAQFTFISLIILATVISYWNLVFLILLKPGQVWLRYVALASSACTGLSMAGLAWYETLFTYSPPPAEVFGRITTAAAIVTTCASLGLLILRHINLRTPTERSGRRFDRLTLICPGCQHKQEVSTGDSHCEGCGLKFSIRIEEPTCQHCGYLLYMLASDRCPECGEPITTVTRNTREHGGADVPPVVR